MSWTSTMGLRSGLALAGLVALIALSAGCKTQEQKLLEETLSLNEDVYAALEQNVEDPDAAVRALVELEESSRDARRKLRSDFLAAVRDMDEADKKAFMEEAEARYKEYAGRFQTIVKRYPQERQQRLRELIGVITH